MKKIITILTVISLLAGTFVPVSSSAKVKTVRLNKKSFTLHIGEQKKLVVTVTPSKYKKKVKWSSDNKAVAVVNSKGLIKAKNKGSAKIIAFIGKSKTVCKVKVISPTSAANENELIPHPYKWSRMKSPNPKFVLPYDIPTQEKEVYGKAVKSALAELNRLRKKENPALPVVSLAHNIQQNTSLVRAQDCLFYMEADHLRPDGSSGSTAGLGVTSAEVCTYGGGSCKIKNIPEAGVQSFWNSHPHKQILLSKDYDRIGIGICYLKNKKNNSYHFTMVMHPSGFTKNYEMPENKKILHNKINDYRTGRGLNKLKYDYINDYNFIAASSYYTSQKRPRNYCVIKNGLIEYPPVPAIELKEWYKSKEDITFPLMEFKLNIDESNYHLFTQFKQNYGTYIDDAGKKQIFSAYSWNNTYAVRNLNEIIRLLFENEDFISTISNPDMNRVYIGGLFEHVILAQI